MLVIVESPNKIKKLQGFLGKDYEVIATKGHFRDLPTAHRGVLPEEWEPIKGKAGVITELWGALKRHTQTQTRCAPKEDCVILATDPDREGEAIAWHVCVVLGLDPTRVMRCRFHEITREAVIHAIARAQRREDVLDMALVNAQRARRLLDRRIGYSGTRHLWRRVGGGVSAGRCLIPAAVLLREVVARETAKGDRLVLRGSIMIDDGIGEASLFREIEDGDTLAEIRKCFGGSTVEDSYVIHNHLRVDSVEQTAVSKAPPKPLNTSTALMVIGGSPARAMAILQSLFEKGLITYHRTDSREVCEDFKGHVLGDSQITSKAPDTSTPSTSTPQTPSTSTPQTPSTSTPQTPSTSTPQTPSAGGALGGGSPPPSHEAIRPTNPDETGDDLEDASEKRAYRIIWEHAIGSLYAPWKGERLAIQLEGGWMLSSERTIAGGEGWLGRIHKAPPRAFAHSIDALHTGDTVVFRSGWVRVRREPRGREVTETSMVRLLEHSGIGRPSTYATIIGNLTKRGLAGLRTVTSETAMEMRILDTPHPKVSWGASVSFVSDKTSQGDGEGDGQQQQQRTGMIVTPVGEQCLRELEESSYTPFFRIPYTAEMETVLDSIASNTYSWEGYVNEIDDAISQAEDESKKMAPSGVAKGGGPVPSPTSAKSRGAFPLTELGSTHDGWVYCKGRTRYGPVVYRFRRGEETTSREYKKVSAKQWELLNFSKVIAMWK